VYYNLGVTTAYLSKTISFFPTELG